MPLTTDHVLDIPIPFTITLERCDDHKQCTVTWAKGTQDECPLCRAVSRYKRSEQTTLESELRKEHKSNG
jgi:hypothetical protein